MTPPTPPRRPRRPRWGLRATSFLLLALVAVVTSGLRAGDTDLLLATTLGTLVGLGGAAYCSVRGLAALRRHGWRG